MIDTIKAKVRKILEDYPKSRDSDIYLTAVYWQKHFPSRVFKNEENGHKFVYLKDLKDLTKQSDISRLRQVVQNVDGEFLPNSPEVRKQRKINEQEWKNYMIKNKQ